MTKPATKRPATVRAPSESQSRSNVISLRSHFRPRNDAQQELSRLIDENKITLALGPAGTGKTYVPIAKAVKALSSGEVDKIILTRPAVAAGESIGFLPGDADDKLKPYMMPLFDALSDFWPVEHIEDLRQKGFLEISPIGYMRGRTLKGAFIVADEIQNATRLQAKMLYSRFGPGSKMVITGDASQCDLNLKPGEMDGISYLERGLNGTPNVGIHRSLNSDVVRDEVVMHGLDALDKFDQSLSPV